MLKRGATTWWETFDRSTPHCSVPYAFTRNNPTYLIDYVPVSYCHGWGSGPAYVLMQNVLGIKPLDSNFREFRFDPYTEGLEYCKGTVPTPYGDIKVEWKKENNELLYQIENQINVH